MVGIDIAITHGIILAAGDGDRMGELTKHYPKVLLPMNRARDPLIASPIMAMVKTGIRNVGIVLGHYADEVMNTLGDGSKYGINITYLDNPDYLGGNAVSVLKAKSWTEGKPVVLCMGDHIIAPEVLQYLLDSKMVEDTLCVEYKPASYHDIGEATKVMLDTEGNILRIGKSLDHWCALDTGVFLLTDRFFKLTEELYGSKGIDIEISDVIRFMIGRGYCFRTCDVSGCSWMDIDIEDDLRLVQTQDKL